MKILLLLATVQTVAAGNCDNPLFSEEFAPPHLGQKFSKLALRDIPEKVQFLA
jgi:hypothetical protein